MTSKSSGSSSSESAGSSLKLIQDYWNRHIHDLEIATEPVGTAGFFRELTEYRREKLAYLSEVVDFEAYDGQRLLEVGCGVGIDLASFAGGGAEVLGVDLASHAIELAKLNFGHSDVQGHFAVMNGEGLGLRDDQFDVVYAHGVVQYTADDRQMMKEIHRVLRPGGRAILMVYNRRSWLNLLSNLVNVELEHEDAPALRKYLIAEFRDLLRDFTSIEIIPERFPVKTRLHGGIKGLLYNCIFVPMFNLVPRRLVRGTGWHLIAKVVK